LQKNQIDKNNGMEVVRFNEIEDRIIKIRNIPVLLDSDVAYLYGVETMRVNEAVKNNPDKFPNGYLFELNKEEKKEVIEIFDNPKIKFLNINRLSPNIVEKMTDSFFSECIKFSSSWRQCAGDTA